MSESQQDQPAREVEMHPAYVWTCEDCGRDSFVRAIQMSLENDPEMWKNIAVLEGLIEEWQGVEDIPEGVDLLCESYPDAVVCDHCRAEFSTLPLNNQE